MQTKSLSLAAGLALAVAVIHTPRALAAGRSLGQVLKAAGIAAPSGPAPETPAIPPAEAQAEPQWRELGEYPFTAEAPAPAPVGEQTLAAQPQPPRTVRVRFTVVNRTNHAATLTVNGTAYNVAANTTREVEIDCPAGENRASLSTQSPTPVEVAPEARTTPDGRPWLHFTLTSAQK